jgi:CheY-like chemotaxis protein
MRYTWHHLFVLSYRPPYGELTIMENMSHTTTRQDIPRVSPTEQRILIVEDNPFNQKVTSMMFYDFGYKNIDVAETGKAGLNLFKQNAYALVILDIGLPDTNGCTVADEMRKYEHAHHQTHTPIVALTTRALEEDKQSALTAGVDEYLVKPLMMNQLQKLCRERLSS